MPNRSRAWTVEPDRHVTATSPTLPNFLVIGAGKGGTTSLHRWLAEHPQVYVSRIKETNFFTWETRRDGSADEPLGRMEFPVRSWEEYLELFAEGAGAVARGEVSPSYLSRPAVPARIAERLPEARLIAVLRHPVERAYSSYLMHARDGRERRTFAEAVRQELEGTADSTLAAGQLRYLRIGHYYRHLSRYWERFPDERMHIELFDDLKGDPGALVGRVYRFLGVDDSFRPDLSARLNPSGVPRRSLLAPFLRKNRFSRVVRRLLPARCVPGVERAYDGWRGRQLVKPPLDPALRRELIERYRDDIERLSDRLSRDLSTWLER